MASPKAPLPISTFLGSSEAKVIAITEDGAAFDLSGYSGEWEFIVKTDADDADGDALLTLTKTGGRITLDAPNGKVTVGFLDTEWAGIGKGRYPYFVRAALASGDKEILVQGLLTLKVPGGV